MGEDKVAWVWRTWNELDKSELYSLLQLRQEIFVIEQRCIYQQLDGLDQQANHLLAYDFETGLIACGRAFAPGTKKTESCLSGICVDASHRGRGIGKKMLLQRIDFLQTNYPDSPIVTSVQEYRVPVYQRLGFSIESERYIMEGEQCLGEPIYHVDMKLLASGKK